MSNKTTMRIAAIALAAAISATAGAEAAATGTDHDHAALAGAHRTAVRTRIRTANEEKVLYAFKGGTDGANPAGSLIADSSGNLYGTAGFGGDSNCHVTRNHFYDHRVKQNPGCGIVFKLSTAGHETILHTFSGGNDGAGPPGALYEDANGNLFGVTAAGGRTKACRRDCGTVFEIPSGGSETLLYAFSGGNDGAAPDGTLTVDSSGNFYGTTAVGGSSANCGAGGREVAGRCSNLRPAASKVFCTLSRTGGAMAPTRAERLCWTNREMHTG